MSYYLEREHLIEKMPERSVLAEDKEQEEPQRHRREDLGRVVMISTTVFAGLFFPRKGTTQGADRPRAAG